MSCCIDGQELNTISLVWIFTHSGNPSKNHFFSLFHDIMWSYTFIIWTITHSNLTLKFHVASVQSKQLFTLKIWYLTSHGLLLIIPRSPRWIGYNWSPNFVLAFELYLSFLEQRFVFLLFLATKYHKVFQTEELPLALRFHWFLYHQDYLCWISKHAFARYLTFLIFLSWQGVVVIYTSSHLTMYYSLLYYTFVCSAVWCEKKVAILCFTVADGNFIWLSYQATDGGYLWNPLYLSYMQLWMSTLATF
jgi:hypothetical protein